MNQHIRPMTAADAGAVLAIYQAGLDTRNASFETIAPPWPAWDAAHLPDHRFVSVDGPVVTGWIAGSPTSTRACYAGVVEHSVYVHPSFHGRGIGRRLLETYIASTEAGGIWTLQTGIFPENAGSLTLHRDAGFRTVGRRERIANTHGWWRDVILLERRAD